MHKNRFLSSNNQPPHIQAYYCRLWYRSNKYKQRYQRRLHQTFFHAQEPLWKLDFSLHFALCTFGIAKKRRHCLWGRYLCRGGEGCKRTEPRNFCSHISWLRRSLENLRPHPWYWIRFRLFCIMLIRPGKHNVLEDYLNTEVVKDIIFLHFMWSQMMFLGCWQPFGLRNPHMGRIHNWMSQIGFVDKFQNTWGTPRHRLPDSPWLWPLSNKEPLASDLRPEP